MQLQMVFFLSTRNGPRKVAFMKKLLMLLTIYEFFRPVHSVYGVIWNKKVGAFVPIFSDPDLAAINQEVFRRSREQETHNFQGKVVRFTYFEETNIVNAEANGTKVSGAIGEIWNILSDYLNFTLKPTISEYHTLGRTLQTSEHYSDGLLKIIQANKTDVIPRVEADNDRRYAIQHSTPLWKTSLQMYIRREEKRIFDWMLKLFAPKVWYAILWTYILLSVCSHLSQKIVADLARQKLRVKLSDHMFYNFGVICGQCCLPESLSKSSNAVELCLNIFSFLIRTCFNGVVLCYMTKTISQPPFHDIYSLESSTSYQVVALSGSFIDLVMQERYIPIVIKLMDGNRYTSIKTKEELYKTVCSPNKLFCMYQSEDLKKASGMYICPLNVVGKSIYNPIIVSGIAWNFEYKRTIDLGIIRLHELGFISLLKQRWIESNNVEKEDKSETDPVDMEEVYLILCIFNVGSLIAFVILILENLTYYYNN